MQTFGTFKMPLNPHASHTLPIQIAPGESNTGIIVLEPQHGVFSKSDDGCWIQWVGGAPPCDVLGSINAGPYGIMMQWTNPLTAGEATQCYQFTVHFKPDHDLASPPLVIDPTVENEPPGNVSTPSLGVNETGDSLCAPNQPS